MYPCHPFAGKRETQRITKGISGAMIHVIAHWDYIGLVIFSSNNYIVYPKMHSQHCRAQELVKHQSLLLNLILSSVLLRRIQT